MTLSNLGVFRQEAGRPNAEEPLRSSVAIAQELASGKNATRKDRQYLAISRNNLGEALRDQGRHDEARGEFHQAIDGLEGLVAENPAGAENRFYLGYVYEQQGKLLARMNQTAAARIAMEKAVASQKQAVKQTDGKLVAYRSALAGHLTGLADVCLTLGDYEGVLQSAVDLARATPDPAQGCLDAAKILAQGQGRLQADAKLALPRKDELGRKFLGRTLVLLREAVDANTKLADLIKNDPVFKQLRDRPEFQIMLSNLVDLGREGGR